MNSRLGTKTPDESSAGEANDRSSHLGGSLTLATTDELFRCAFEDTRVPMVLTDLENRFVRVNLAFVRLFGYSLEETLQLTMQAITHPDDVSESLRRREGLLRDEADYFQVEKRYFRKDGTQIWGLTNVSLVRDRETRAPQLYIGQIQDITERRRAEEELVAADHLLRQALSSSPSVLVMLSVSEGQLRPTWISDNVRHHLGHTAGWLLNPDHWDAQFHPEDLPRLTSGLLRELLRHDRVSREFRFRRADGSYAWISGEIRASRDAEGEIAEIVSSWTDITEKRRLEEQFRQAQKLEAVGRLAGGIAHDFNNLLAVISGYGDLLELRGDLPAEALEWIEQINRAGERASGLTRQLLAFSRKGVQEPQRLDLAFAVRDLSRMLKRLIGEDVELDLVWKADEVIPIHADPTNIEQIIMNLAVNARDAMPQGGKLTLEVRRVAIDEVRSRQLGDLLEGEYALLVVSDSGCGMDDETMAHIFEPFFTTKAVGKGTGLGLATVYGIVRQYSGHIWIYSEVGRGTTVKIYFPILAPSHEPASAHTDSGQIKGGVERILLVEDDEAVRSVARSILGSLGYQIVEFALPNQAMEYCSRHGSTIDLLLTDVVMPQINGREVAEHCRQCAPQAKVLFMSGYTDDAVIRHGVLSGAADFIEKPFSARSLAIKVREVLDS